MTTTLSNWMKLMADPHFPFQTLGSFPLGDVGIKKPVHLDEGLELGENSEEGDAEPDELRPCIDPLCGWSSKKYKTEGGGRDKNGNLRGKVWISLESGGEFRGYVENGRREGECSVTCLESGVRMLRASYYNDRPEGFVKLEREDGSWREGFCLDGVWEGLVREFDSDRNLKFVGRYSAGSPTGVCWLRLTGSAFLYGQMFELEQSWRLNSENGFYIYPDLVTGYNGTFLNSVMVRARAVDVESGGVEDGIMRVKVTKIYGPERSYQEATEDCLSSYPLLGDPYEWKMVVLGSSSVVGGGEGLFAKADIAEGTLCTLYNGVKRGPYSAGETPDDWDKCGYSIGYFESTHAEKGWGDMDIPSQFQSSDNYVATLGHKMNHSFSPNCEFSDLIHPVFGYIPCTMATKPVKKGEELFVHYHYVLNDCPQWYEDLYNQL